MSTSTGKANGGEATKPSGAAVTPATTGPEPDFNTVDMRPRTIAKVARLRGTHASPAAPAEVPDAPRPQVLTQMWWAVSLAGGAAAVATAPRLFGLSPTSDTGFYARNAAVAIMTFMAAYLVWRRGLRGRSLAGVGATLAATLVAVNMYPFAAGSASEIVIAWHVPLGLWVLLGVTHAGTWRPSHEQWMAYLRFTGEWVTTVVLFLVGTLVVREFTLGVLAGLQYDVAWLVDGWLLLPLVAGAAVAAVWLVDAGHSRVGPLTLVVSRALVSLLSVLLFAFVTTAVLTRDRLSIDNGSLPVTMTLLAVVMGVMLYAIASRRGTEKVQIIDRIQFALIIIAWGLSGMLFASAMASIVANGARPASLATAVASVVMFANFFWTSWVGHVMLHNNCLFERLDRFQTRFVPIYAIWAAVIVVALPPLFDFA